MEIMITTNWIKEVWTRLFGKKDVPVYEPDDVDLAIDRAIDEMSD